MDKAMGQGWTMIYCFQRHTHCRPPAQIHWQNYYWKGMEQFKRLHAIPVSTLVEVVAL